MPLSKTEKRLIAGRARTLQERLETPPESVETEPPEDPDEWLDRWREVGGVGDSVSLSSRLERADCSETACRRALATHEWPRDRRLPDWVEELDELLAFVEENADRTRRKPNRDRENDTPFVDVLVVIADYAKDRLRRTAELDGVTESGMRALEEWLLDRLRAYCVHPLFIEFKTFVATRDEELALADDPPMPERPRQYYDQFTSSMLDGELESFFLEYSLLGRLVVTIIRQWVDATVEFCTRLAADRNDVQETFSPDAPLGDVTDVEAMGDRHEDGRVVFGVTFESGTRLAYKPRSVGTEAEFYDFLSWINERANHLDLLTLDCLRRDEYGWMEWAEHAECTSAEEVERYYRRAGMLLCVLYALKFADGHFENVVAAGEHPVVVDLETLMHPDPPTEKTPRVKAVSDVVGRSVVETAMLPAYVDDTKFSEVSGLEFSEEPVSEDDPRFKNVNTDVMSLEFDDERTPESANLPTLEGSVASPRDYRGEIERGFEQTYRFLLDRKDELLADGGPLSRFEDVEIRYLFRSTSSYGSILLSSLTYSTHLRTGLDVGCEIESLAKPLLSEEVDAELWPIYEREQTALTRLDVPRFTTTPEGTDVRSGDWVTEDVLDEPCLRRTRERIARMSPADLDEQLDYVELAFRDPGAPRPTTSAPRDSDASDELHPASAWNDAPREIFARLSDRADAGRDGEPTWFLRKSHPDGGVRIRSVGDDLYSGRVGIGLFAAALAHVFDEEQYRSFAVDVTRPLRDLSSEDRLADLPIGAGSGIGSVVYGCTRIAHLLDDDRFVTFAERAGELLTPSRISQDETYDLLGGSAGALLGLLVLFDATDDPDVLDRAIRCGRHLLENRVETSAGPRVWRTGNDGRPLAGASHGVAGIAYSLCRLAAVADAPRFRDAAFEALEFERRLYSEERNNWPDLRNGTTNFADTWCHGRPGVGLSRLGTYELTEADVLRRDAVRALRGVDADVRLPHDHVCCGNFGRVEFLLRAARTLDDPEYRRRARRLAAASVERADDESGFPSQWHTDHWYNPTFFEGEAGIGYTLLRLDNPELPCVLLWE